MIFIKSDENPIPDIPLFETCDDALSCYLYLKTFYVGSTDKTNNKNVIVKIQVRSF